MMITATKRIWAFVLAFLMVLGTLPVFALGGDEPLPEGYRVLRFGDLSSGVLWQTCPLGASLEDLALPETLPASVSLGQSEYEADVTVLDWASTPAFDGDTAGTYEFSPLFSDELELDAGAEPPIIEVRVGEGGPYPFSGSVSRNIVLARQAVENTSGELLGEALEADRPYAKALWDILKDLQYGDESRHPLAFPEAARPRAPLSLGYSGGLPVLDTAAAEALDAAVDEIVASYLVPEVAQPAADALRADFPAMDWLGDEMELQLAYVAQDGELYIDQVHFSFTYGQALAAPLALGDDVVVLYDNVEVAGFDGSGAFAEAVEYVNTTAPYKDNTDMDRLVIRLEADIIAAQNALNANTDTSLPKMPCTIEGDAAGRLFRITAGASNTTAVLTLRNDMTLKNLNIQGFNGSSPLKVLISTAHNLTLRSVTHPDGNETDTDKKSIELTGPGTSTDKTLVLENATYIRSFRGFKRVELGGSCSVLEYCISDYLRLRSGADLRMLSSQSIRTASLTSDNATITLAQYNAVDGPIRRFLEFRIASGVTTGFSGTLELVNDTGTDYTIGDSVVYVNGASEAQRSVLDEVVESGAISLGAGFSPLWGLKRAANGNDILIHTMAVKVTQGSRVSEHELFSQAAAKAATLYAEDQNTEIVMSIRQPTDADAWPAVPVTLEGDGDPALSAYVKSLTVTGAPSLAADLRLRNITLLSTSGTNYSLYGNDHNLTLLDGADISGASISMGGGDLAVRTEAPGGTMTNDVEIVRATGVGAATVGQGAKLRISGTGGGDLGCTGLTLESNAVLNASPVSCGALTMGSGASLRCTTLSCTGAATLGADAALDATSVNCAGTLALGSGAAVSASVAASPVTVKALQSSGGSILYTGAAKPNHILSITDSVPAAGIGGSLKIDIDGAGYTPVEGDPVIQVTGGNLIPEDTVDLVGTRLADFVLQLRAGGSTVYELAKVRVRVFHDGETKKFTGFAPAVGYVDNLQAGHGAVTMQLYDDVTVDGGSGMPAKPVTITGPKQPSGSYTLASTTAGFTLNGDTTFTGITLAASVSNWDLAIGSRAATLGDDVVFAGGLGGVNGAPNGAGSLTLAGAAYTLAGEIRDVHTLNATNQTPPTITLRRLGVFGTLNAGGATFVFTENGNDVDGNMDAPATLVGSVNVDSAAASVPLFEDKFLRLPKPRQSVDYDLSGIVRTGAFADMGLALSVPDTGGYNYYLLSMPVKNITVAASPAAGVTYGDEVTLTAILTGAGALQYAPRPGHSVVFSYSADGGATKVTLGSATIPTASAGARERATATILAGSGAVARLPAGSITVYAAYENPDDSAEAASGQSAALSIAPRPVAPVYRQSGGVNLIRGAVDDKPYDGTAVASLKSGTIPGLLDFSPAILSGDAVSIDAASAKVEFSDQHVSKTGNAVSAKQVKITGIALTGAQAGNYQLTGLTSGGLPLTESTAKINPLSLTASPLAVVGKEYDGTTAATLSVGPFNILPADQGIVSVSYGAVAFDSPNAGVRYVNNISWSVTVTNPDYAHDYSASGLPTSLPGTISRKVVTLNVAVPAPSTSFHIKEYDGGTGMKNGTAGISATAAGLIAADASLAGEVATLSAYYDNANAGAGKTYYADFSLNPGLRTNYTLAAGQDVYTGTETLGADGEITRYGIDPLSVHPTTVTVMVPAGDPAPRSYSLSLNVTGSHPGSAGGAFTFEVDSAATGNVGAYLSAVSVDQGSTLRYTPQAATADGDRCTVYLFAGSPNYQVNGLIEVTFLFVDKEFVEISAGGLSIEGTAPGGKLYDGRQITITGAPKFYEEGTVNEIPGISPSDVVYTFIDIADGSSGGIRPKDAGTYRVILSVETNDYIGRLEYPDPVVIRPRAITVAPVDDNVAAGGALPAWTDAARFTAGGADSLAPNETLAAHVFVNVDGTGYDLAGALDVAGLHTDYACVQSVEFLPGRLPAPRNYTVTGGAGTFRVTERVFTETDIAGFLTFDPASPDGQNGWYVTDILVYPNNTGTYRVRAGTAGPFGTSVTLRDQRAEPGQTVDLYLATAAGNHPYGSYTFTYKLDTTEPALSNMQFIPYGDGASGIIFLSATDVHAGVASVTAQRSGGGLLTFRRQGNTDVYSVMVSGSGAYTLTATDLAGNTATSTLLVDVTQAALLVFSPAAPDGQNGWYRTAITATSSNPANYKVGVDASGPFSESVRLSQESAADVTANLYLRHTGSGVVSGPLSRTYRLDMTEPALSNGQFIPDGNRKSGIISLEAADAHAGVASVTAQRSGGGLLALQRQGNTDRYAVAVSESGTYTLTATDFAGNAATAALQVDVTQAAWLVFSPAAPDGQNGWYRTAITATPSDPANFEAGTDANGPFSGSAELSQESRDGVTAELYLRHTGSGAVSGPVAHTYRLDRTPPAIANGSFRQNANQLDGILSAEITDAHSGVAGVTAQMSGGPLLTMTKGAGDLYTCDLQHAGEYTVTAADAAGNVSTSRVTVQIRPIEIDPIPYDPDDPNGWYDPDDPSTWPDPPAVVIPPGSLPEGLTAADVMLLISPLAPDKREAMEAAIRASSRETITDFLNSNYWPQNTDWWEIRLVLKADPDTDVELVGPVYIFLRYPAGTSASRHRFLVLHQMKSIETVRHNTYAAGIRFAVDSLSPFSVTAKRVSSPSDSGSAGSGSGRWGSGSQDFSQFWKDVVDAINSAKPGDTVTAHCPAGMTQCPGTVPGALLGKDINLLIRWQGEDVRINGLQLMTPDSNAIYLIPDLLKLLKLRVADLENPATGGDDYDVFPGAVLKTPSLDHSLEPHGLPQTPFLPSLPGTSGRPGRGSGREAPAAASPDRTGYSPQSMESWMNWLAFLVLLFLGALTWAILPRKGEAQPAAEGVPSAGRIAVKPRAIVVTRLSRPEPPHAEEAPVPLIPEAAPEQAAIPATAEALPAAAGKAARETPEPQPARAASAPAEYAPDRSFSNVVAGHKELYRMLQAGEITQREYERKKRILLMRM